MTDQHHASSQASPQPQPQTLDACGYDWLDTFAVEQVRWLCMAYGHGASRGWEKAIMRADEVLGPEQGPALFGGVSAVMTAIRQGRHSPFEFSDPGCPVCSSMILPHERAIMSIIRAGRRDDEAALDAHAFLFLEGADPATLKSAALRLGAIMVRVDKEQQQLNLRWRRPAPRPV